MTTRYGETPWYDSDITPEVPQNQVGREFRAQQEMAPMPPCPCCGESRQDHLWRLLGSEVRCDECGRHYQAEGSQEMAKHGSSLADLNEARLNQLVETVGANAREQSALITDLQTQIDKLTQEASDD